MIMRNLAADEARWWPEPAAADAERDRQQYADGDAHFMQMSLEVMSRDQNVINALRDDTPAIRNALILVYSGAMYEEVTTREGKEKLLADGLAEIRKIMKPRLGAGRVEALYFTALVIQ